MAAGATTLMERKTGVALWRQVADRIRQLIGSGEFDEDDRLPPEIALAARFGVNRHTVRNAIAALVQEGALRAEQGRGTFIQRRRRFTYPISARTRFSEGLRDQARERRGHLLSHAREKADIRIAEALGIPESGPVVRMETVSEADARPVSRATSWFDAERFSGIAEAFAQTGSVTIALRQHGVEDYFRKTTVVSARHAETADLTDLKLAPGAIVLVAVALNVDPQGRPVQFSETRFAADRVELSVTG